VDVLDQAFLTTISPFYHQVVLGGIDRLREGKKY
jgi:hypothetical protein